MSPAHCVRIISRLRAWLRPATLLLLCGLLSACSGRADADVVLYVALDQNFSEPIVREFERRTGLVVRASYDVEANKSVGLRRRLQEEAERPVCDVFWNNETAQTVLLADQGLLESYVSPAAAEIPAAYKDPAGFWTGFAVRGRVLIVNSERFPDAATQPAGWEAFLDPAHAERAGMARPLTGTTATHIGWFIARDGLQPTLDLLERLRGNGVHFGPGNAHLMRLVRTGELDFGWTDTDDCQVAIDAGFPVRQVIPDQHEGGDGLMVIPNTVSVVKGGPNPENARLLVDFLLSRQVEELLAAAPSAQIPVRSDVPRPPHVIDLSRWRIAEVDWQAAGRAYAQHADVLEAFFVR